MGPANNMTVLKLMPFEAFGMPSESFQGLPNCRAAGFAICPLWKLIVEIIPISFGDLVQIMQDYIGFALDAHRTSMDLCPFVQIQLNVQFQHVK